MLLHRRELHALRFIRDRLLLQQRDFPKDCPILIITDGLSESNLQVARDHAFLLSPGKRLPFPTRKPVFAMALTYAGLHERLGGAGRRDRRRRRQMPLCGRRTGVQRRRRPPCVYREDIYDGLENASKAFIGMLGGENFGKVLVRLVAEA
jgi:hypothetical protein